VFDFALTGEELARIDGLDTGHRNGPDPDQELPARILDRVIPED